MLQPNVHLQPCPLFLVQKHCYSGSVPKYVSIFGRWNIGLQMVFCPFVKHVAESFEQIQRTEKHQAQTHTTFKKCLEKPWPFFLFRRIYTFLQSKQKQQWCESFQKTSQVAQEANQPFFKFSRSIPKLPFKAKSPAQFAKTNTAGEYKQSKSPMLFVNAQKARSEFLL